MNQIHICVTAESLRPDSTASVGRSFSYDIVAVVGDIFTARHWRGIPPDSAHRVMLFQQAVNEMIKENYDMRETQRTWNEMGIVG